MKETTVVVITVIKVKQHEYEITEKDRFMDNGHCVQLLTQNKQYDKWGKAANPVLSKRVIKEMSAFNRIRHEHDYGCQVTIFSLKKPETE